MNFTQDFEGLASNSSNATRSHSAQGLTSSISSPAMKFPLPPRMWITDVSDDESSDELNFSIKDDGVLTLDRPRVRSRFRHQKQRPVPIGIFWDIENCQVPRGCCAIDVVAAIRNKFLVGRREADFVVVCDVRKESTIILQELNDAQVNLIHVCGTQKNAADDKLRQCMRRFGELHTTPAALLLVSGDINFAADLSDFRHRKNMEVILVHKQNTSSALIACASSHYCYNDLLARVPRRVKAIKMEDRGDSTCEVEVTNLPIDMNPERVSKRLRRLADNCGGKILRITAPTATLRFPTPDHASRALKRMDGEDVFGRKIGTRYVTRGVLTNNAYSSDEGYSTGSAVIPAQRHTPTHHQHQAVELSVPAAGQPASALEEWRLALQQLPTLASSPSPLGFTMPAPPAPPAPPAHPAHPAPPAPPAPPAAHLPRPRKIRGTHGSVSLDRSGCSSSNSGDDGRQKENSQSRAISPWNSSASFSEQSSEGEQDSPAELTVSNLPPFEPAVIQDMLKKLFSQYVQVLKVSAWVSTEGPIATIVLRSECDARLAIARIHKRRLDSHWSGRRLELSLGRPNPAPNLDILRARLRSILLHQANRALPLLRLRDAYASRYCSALTTSEIAKVKDTVRVHEGFGRLVELIDITPVKEEDLEEAPWRCHIHASINTSHEDGSRILMPVYIELEDLARNTKALLHKHAGILPLLSFVDCYESMFVPLQEEPERGVSLEFLLRSVPGLEVRDSPSRHITWRPERSDTPPGPSNHSDCSRWSAGGVRTAPTLEPMLALFERELLDLLRTAPRCSLPFGKLIPAFHHHFGRQCRVADYGFTKLPDLLAALSNTIVVLGSGSSRVITISSSAQTRRWTSDLVKVLRAQPMGRPVPVHDLPQAYHATFGRAFATIDYGACTLRELVERVPTASVGRAPDGALCLPRRDPTIEERARATNFAAQAVELLRHTPNLRMEFARFVPAYHAHFGRQLRVAHYGCLKLAELLEMVPHAVTVYAGTAHERSVRLAPVRARAEMSRRIRSLAAPTGGTMSLAALVAAYAAQYGVPPSPDAMGVRTIEALIYAIGGCVEDGLAHVPPSLASGRWSCACLSACAALTADRSVAARGSTYDFFAATFRKLHHGVDPDLANLEAAGVVITSENRVQLTQIWRTIWRVAQIIIERGGSSAAIELYVEYTKRFEPTFPHAELGYETMLEFLRHHPAVFVERAGMAGVGGVGGERWELSAGVGAPRARDLQPLAHREQRDYSLFDTPPGQKGSRVFESPKTNIWCSPPASALPSPSALLNQDNKRRTRLAAQFDLV